MTEKEISIRLNGEEKTSHASTVEELLQDLNINTQQVAVERNKVLVKKDQFNQTPLQDGDHIEIVTFVGGG